jgi:hypothetical protein
LLHDDPAARLQLLGGQSRRDALRELVRLHAKRGDREAVNRRLPQSLLADPAMSADPLVRDALGLAPPRPSEQP